MPNETNIDTSSYKGVWCYVEQRHGKIIPATYELLHIGRKLADDLKEELCVILMGNNIENEANSFFEYGADMVYVFNDAMFENLTCGETHSQAIAELAASAKPNKILFPATIIGRSLASRLAITLETGLVADATEISVGEGGSLNITRPAYGGSILATVVSKKARPEMVTVRPMSYPKAQKTSPKQGKIEKPTYDASKWNVQSKFVKYVPEEGEVVDLSSAEKIVSGGRGLGKANGFEIIGTLAKEIGAAVGASRPAVDLGWIPYRHQVGLTGRTVKPKLYVACGISGQIQHLAGMGQSDVIIAINKDPECPMMKMANYSIEADVYEFIPLLVEEIKKRKS
ncbi:electron transfer flavoprotein subunit alpha/FixB family protein [Elusimicrobiota bacterium]